MRNNVQFHVQFIICGKVPWWINRSHYSIFFHKTCFNSKSFATNILENGLKMQYISDFSQEIIFYSSIPLASEAEDEAGDESVRDCYGYCVSFPWGYVDSVQSRSTKTNIQRSGLSKLTYFEKSTFWNLNKTHFRHLQRQDSIWPTNPIISWEFIIFHPQHLISNDFNSI